MPLSVTELVSAEDLRALRPEWWSLWERCPAATPFQTPEWVLAWLRHIFGGGKLWTVVVRVEGRLAGLAPLFVYGRDARRVAMLGAGITDYLDILADPELEADVAGAIVKHVSHNGARWDECEWGDLNPASALAAGAEEDTPCPTLELPHCLEDLLSVLPAKFRTDLRRSQNRLARAGAQFECAAPEQTPEYMETLFRLHTAAWRARGEAGVLACAELQAFHREAASGLLGRGVLRLWGLRIEGVLRSVIYGFAARGRTYAYLGGFDPELSKLSPGTALMGYAIERSIGEGMREFDFLRGGEECKYQWGARNRRTRRLRLRHA